MPKVLLIRAPGTNCDDETAYAFELAGATTRVVHVNALLAEPRQLHEHDIFCIPGGFSYGDDIGAGQVLALQIKHHLLEDLQRFRSDGKLILGICNGFQALIKSGLLVAPDRAGNRVTLTWNDNGRYTDRWVRLSPLGDRCVFLRGVESLYLPIAHGEGKFVARDEATLRQLQADGQLSLRYGDAAGADNPNGSVLDVAGLCDESGRVFGLMPHPERHIHRTHHPRWTRLRGDERPDGLAIFRNAVAACS
ncbi:MAG: phosphoribosylformylglycinamidine synthase I [Planctomycetota bacterium]|jgi:phosphoribosylformylglycinamidine synthase I|nr:phosphoribosylformylglycinamidine synthase I [Blastopirellula sp.]